MLLVSSFVSGFIWLSSSSQMRFADSYVDRFCYRTAGYFSVEHVQAAAQSRVGGKGCFPAHVGQLHRIRKRCIGQGVGSSTCNGARHVCHAVVDHSIFDVRGFIMRGRAVALNQPARPRMMNPRTSKMECSTTAWHHAERRGTYFHLR